MLALRIAAGLFTFAGFALSAVAQPNSGSVQPDCLHFGDVHTGAIVEASFLIFEAGKDPDISIGVTAPKFVKVLRKSTGHQEYGPGNDYIRGTVEFQVDTSEVGELTGEINVALGNAAAKVPISAIVKQAKKGQPRILIAETPFAAFSTDDGNDFKPWTDLAREAALDVSYLLIERGKPVLRDVDLSKYQCVFLAGSGLIFLQPEDVKRVQEFAQAGGRVVLAANRFFVGTVPKANEVLKGSAIEMQDVEGNGGREHAVLDERDLSSLLVDAGVKSAHFFRASPIQVIDPRAGQVLAQAKGIGSERDGFIAVADVNNGQMIALGESLWWSWITEKNAAGTDNAAMLRWLLTPAKKD